MSSGSASSFIEDAAVRTEVIDPERSFIVQAPAGSGKTELLTQRFLSLLAKIEKPEALLAITFTRKAASEMRLRVLNALQEAATRSGSDDATLESPHRERRELARLVLARDREKQWNLLEAPTRLQIRTVDSLSDSIARQLPTLAAISGDLQVSEQSDHLYRQAADRTIVLIGSEQAAHSSAIHNLLFDLDNRVNKLRDLLVSMLRKRDQWLRFFGASHLMTDEDSIALRARLEDSLERTIVSELRDARAQLHSLLTGEIDELTSFARIAALDPKGIESLRDLRALPPATIDALPLWRSFREFLLTKEGAIRAKINAGNGLPDKSHSGPCTDLFKALGLREESTRICSLLKFIAELPVPKYSAEEWRFVRSLLMALPLAVANLKTVFAESGSVDFIEISQAATNALKASDGPTELALAMGTRISHLLIDEFQDTSTSQLDFVNALIAAWEPQAGNSLFLVGDPMQSIYAFREAEVSIFTRSFSGNLLANSEWPLEPRKLSTNFRSQRELVAWFNDTHSQILTRNVDAIGAVGYTPATATKPAEDCSVVIHGFPPKAYDAEAEYIATEISKVLVTNSDFRIAVLVRSRAHLRQLARTLYARAIDYSAVDIDLLAQRQTARDLDAIAKAIIDVSDRTAWLTLLRAPWCGLELSDLWVLCRGDDTSTLLDLIDQRSSLLSSAGQQRLARVAAIIKKAVADRTRLPLRLVVERAWVSLGGPASLASEDREAQIADADRYFDFLQQCSVDAVAPGTRDYEERFAKLYSPPSTRPGVRVELMTIHGAKGLEWDVVFIPALGRSPQRDKPELLYWREQLGNTGGELLLAPMVQPSLKKSPNLERLLRHLKQVRSDEETKRLIYVATTRARKRLYLTATLNKSGQPDSRSLLSFMWPVTGIREAFQKDVEIPSASAIAPAPAGGVQRLRRLRLNTELPAAPKPLLADSIQQISELKDLHTYDWAGEVRRRVGTVTHAFLQSIARAGLSTWDVDRVIKSRAVIKLALANAGVGQKALDSATDEVSNALRETLSDDRGRWILHAHPESFSEYPITTVVEGLPRRLKIDRTFVENGVRWIIDFKTTQIEGGSAEQHFDREVEKYREDLSLYVRAIKAVDSRPVHCALYFPLQRVWREVLI